MDNHPTEYQTLLAIAERIATTDIERIDEDTRDAARRTLRSAFESYTEYIPETAGENAEEDDAE